MVFQTDGRFAYALHMHYVWIAYALRMHYVWIAYALRMDCVCITYALRTENFLTANFLTENS